MTKPSTTTKNQSKELTIMCQGNKISLAEYNRLTTDEQLDLIHQARGRKKYELLINARQVEKLVTQLHPQELYLTINELGAEYSTELLALASPEQLTTILDLDCWDDDNLSSVLSLHWLELLLETGVKKVCQLITQMEPELLALFLKKHLTIIRGMEVYDNDDVENARRLEGLYDIEYHSENAAKIIGALLNIWFEHEQESYLLIMEMIRSEILSILEEEVYQTRSQRLLDLGIIPAIEARSIYSYLDPEAFKPGGKTDYYLKNDDMQHPAAMLACGSPQDLLAEILAGSVDHGSACELLFLVNRKMSADKIDLSETRQVTETFQSTYDTINLALEFLAQGDLEKGEQIFRTTYLLHLFQLGHSLIKRHQLKAEKIAADNIYQYLDYPEQIFIDSLLQQPAAIYLEANGENPAQLRNIHSSKDLLQAKNRLTQIESLQDLFQFKLPFGLPQSTPESAEHPTLSAIFLTAAANQLLGRDFNPALLTRPDHSKLKEQTFVAGQLSESFRQHLTVTMQRFTAGCDFFIEFCLEAWEDTFLDLDSQSTELPLADLLLFANEENLH